jgi:integrase
MSVYTRESSPFWIYDFQCRSRRFQKAFDGTDGRPRLTKDRPKREAERAEAVIRNRAETEPTRRDRLTLAEAVIIYWERSGKDQADSAGERGRLGDLERIIGSHVYIDEIDDATVAKFVAKRRTENARFKKTVVANGTVNRGVETLSRIMKCVRRECRMPETIPEWGNHKLEEPRERVRSLTIDEDQRLFGAIDEIYPDMHDMVEFALITMKRLAEVIFIEKANVDRRARTARVIQKGGQEIVIALTDRAMAIVERNWMNHPTRLFTYVNQMNKVYVQKGVTVAVRKGNRRPYTQDGWRKRWKRILAKAEISDFHFHDLRHTAGTRILAATGNLKAVQVAADHANIASSARYAHMDAEQKRDALEAAERFGANNGRRNVK